ncbi:hypothetical protein, unlikely [Trypanosoma brucei gambiense DAL972]|uniref:Uncharacterized protein n=1 Tax=Trypanosoma brucei gambiense (strain MHOM/CI/86/DAL972) TaxID=679716 RepID=D0A9T1_TRYB9|nr:hypothetical protein, unlikely [Trypanosoma brucei gambiense DAL972]CBH18432.1 hypothetical protein, unlikely [Trypanosoma brucei gambiense DAL972]|eukprot:XP_011780696.1 hypothetical protein, unlikely [Trypanosoma brucei gambiense DAL972]
MFCILPAVRLHHVVGAAFPPHQHLLRLLRVHCPVLSLCVRFEDYFLAACIVFLIPDLPLFYPLFFSYHCVCFFLFFFVPRVIPIFLFLYYYYLGVNRGLCTELFH